MKIPYSDLSGKSEKFLLGSIVTVLTRPTNRPFIPTDSDFVQYFVGLLVGVNLEGIWLQQVGGSGLTWFYRDQVVGISQEQILDPQDQEDSVVIDKIKKEIENKDSEVTKKAAEIQSQKTLNPAALEELSAQLTQKD